MLIDNNYNFFKLSDEIDNSDKFTLMHIPISKNEMTWEEAKNYVSEFFDALLEQLNNL